MRLLSLVVALFPLFFEGDKSVPIAMASPLSTTLIGGRRAVENPYRHDVSRRSADENSSAVVSTSCDSSLINQTFITIQASSTATHKLKSILQGVSAQVVFFYFNLVVGNTTFHPGSCPNDGKSAIDAKTPLAWVFVRQSVPGSIFDRYSFARAYLTFPVSYPRIYSLGILSGNYVEDLNHAVYGMKAVVDVHGGCWESFDLDNRRKRFFDAVQQFYKELVKNTGVECSWNICFSNPVTSGLPRGIPDLGKSRTPAYFCKKCNGNISKLERDAVMVAIVGLCWFLVIVLLLFTVYLVVAFVIAVFKWGVSDNSHLTVEPTDSRVLATLRLRERFFSELHLPVSVSIGGIICAEAFLGRKAAWRLKCIFLMTVFVSLYTFIPIYTMHILTPQQERNTTDNDDSSFGVKNAETFGRPCCDSYVGVFRFFVILPAVVLLLWLIFQDPTKLDEGGKPPWEAAAELVRLSVRSLVALFVMPFSLARVVVHWPSATWQRDKDWLSRLQSLICFFPLFVLWLIFFLTLTSVLVALAAFVDIIEGPIALFVFAVTWGCFSNEWATYSDKKLSTCQSQNAQENDCKMAGTWACMKRLFPYVLILFATGCFVFNAIVVTSRLLMFSLLSFLAVWLNYPVETVFFFTWLFAFVKEIRMVSTDYYAPLRTVWKIYITELRKMVLEGKETPIAKPWEGNFLSFNLDLSETRENSPETSPHVDWKLFLTEAEKTYDVSCLNLLTTHCQRKLFPSMYELGNDKDHTVSCDEGHKDEEFAVTSSVCLTTKSDSGKASNDVSKELTELQAVLRILYFRRLAEGCIVIIALITFLLLLIGFNTLWDTPGTNPKETSNLLSQYLILPLFAYYRSSLQNLEIGQLDQKHIADFIQKRLNEDMKKATLGEGRTTTPASSAKFSRQNESSATARTAPPESESFSCGTCCCECMKEACPFNLDKCCRKAGGEQRRRQTPGSESPEGIMLSNRANPEAEEGTLSSADAKDNN